MHFYIEAQLQKGTKLDTRYTSRGKTKIFSTTFLKTRFHSENMIISISNCYEIIWCVQYNEIIENTETI